MLIAVVDNIIELEPLRMKTPVAAKYVGLSDSELRTRARSGLIRANKSGRDWMYFRIDLDRMVEGERRKTEFDFTPV